MTSHPILFSSAMVRAVQAGTKTQTRRVMKLQPSIAPTVLFGEEARLRAGPAYQGQALAIWPGESEFDYSDCHCSYGAPGDLLWVRERCRAEELGDDPGTYPQHIIDRYVDETNGAAGLDGVRYYADSAFIEIENTEAASMRWGELRGPGDYRRPWRWRPSIHMPRWASRITLKLIDVRVERVQEISQEDAFAEGVDLSRELYPLMNTTCKARKHFSWLWDSLNAKRGYSWESNPWVWVLMFRNEKPPELLA